MPEMKSCIDCPYALSIYSEACKGYMWYCSYFEKKINVYEDYKDCSKEVD